MNNWKSGKTRYTISAEAEEESERKIWEPFESVASAAWHSTRVAAQLLMRFPNRNITDSSACDVSYKYTFQRCLHTKLVLSWHPTIKTCNTRTLDISWFLLHSLIDCYVFLCKYINAFYEPNQSPVVRLFN